MNHAVDPHWLAYSGIMILIMQVGFAMLEGGTVQKKNIRSVMIKNILDVMIATLAFWLCGYAFAFGCQDNSCSKFVGSRGFALENIPEDEYVHFFYQLSFTSTAVTIVSGAMLERTKIEAYIALSCVIAGFIQPVVTHSFVGGGFLGDKTIIDFAGCGSVHIVGGSAGLCAAYFLGPRKHRFQVGEGTQDNAHLQGRYSGSSVYVVLGGLIMWTGWYAFNTGGMNVVIWQATTREALIDSQIILVNTTTAAIGGIMVAMFFSHKRMLISSLINATLTGLVASTAGVCNLAPWSSFVVGAIAGVVYHVSRSLVVRLGVDDPLDVAAVHLGGGLWGLIAAGLFPKDDFPRQCSENGNLLGVLRGGNSRLLWWQLVYGIWIVLWTCSTVSLLLYVLKKRGLLRVSGIVEESGLDKSYFGGQGSESMGHVSIDDIILDLSSQRAITESEDLKAVVTRLHELVTEAT